MAQQLGGKVEGGHHREFGRAEVEVAANSPLFEGVWRRARSIPVWMSHGDRVTELPPGFRVLGTSPNAPIAMIGDDKRKFYATQFHLEVMHTPHGAAILRNFVRKIAGLTGDWTMRAFKDEAIEKIRETGRQGQGDLRPVRRRRQRGRGGADPRGDRRAADLRVRRSRPDAARGGREGRHDVPRLATTFRWCTWTRATTFLKALEGVDDPEVRSARPSASCSSTCSSARRRRSAARSSWRRARSTRT